MTLSSDWTSSELFDEKRYSQEIKRQSKKNKELHGVMLKDYEYRMLHRFDHDIDRIDTSYNVRLALAQDPRYLKLNRLMQRTTQIIPDRFDKATGHRIMHDAHMFIKYKDNEEFLKKFETKMAANFDSYFSDGGQCKLCKKRQHDFDRRGYLTLESDFELEQIQDYDTDGNNRREKYGMSLDKVLAILKPGFIDPEMERLKQIKASKKPPPPPPLFIQSRPSFISSDSDLSNIFMFNSSRKLQSVSARTIGSVGGEKLEAIRSPLNEQVIPEKVIPEQVTPEQRSPIRVVLKPRDQKVTMSSVLLPKIERPV
jgi:hypothetical protein